MAAEYAAEVSAPTLKVILLGTFTFGASVPALLGQIEPMLWSDARARFVFMGIAGTIAFLTFFVSMPKNRTEMVGRIASAAALAFIFLSPLSHWFHSVTGQRGIDLTKDGPGKLPFDAALYAVFACGVFGWPIWSAIVGVANNPKRIGEVFGLILQGKFKDAIQSVFATQDSTNTNGTGQSQPSSGVTLTPEQTPVKEVAEPKSADPTIKTT